MTTFYSTNDHDSVEYIPKEYDTCAPSHIRYPQDVSLIPQNGEEVQTFFEKKHLFHRVFSLVYRGVIPDI